MTGMIPTGYLVCTIRTWYLRTKCESGVVFQYFVYHPTFLFTSSFLPSSSTRGITFTRTQRVSSGQTVGTEMSPPPPGTCFYFHRAYMLQQVQYAAFSSIFIQLEVQIPSSQDNYRLIRALIQQCWHTHARTPHMSCMIPGTVPGFHAPGIILLQVSFFEGIPRGYRWTPMQPPTSQYSATKHPIAHRTPQPTSGPYISCYVQAST